MKAHGEVTTGWRGKTRPLMLGVILAVLSGGLCLLLTAVLMTFVDISPAVQTLLSVLSAAAGAFFGGMLAARIAQAQGWLMGLLCGLALFVPVLIAGLLIHHSVQIGFLFIKLAVLLVCGMAGGMIGVNKK